MLAENQPDNKIMDLKRFFSTEARPCSLQEVREFWSSLTEEEKSYYRRVKLD